MTTPVWRCYGCEGPVPMCEDGPERWFEITEYREGEMQAVGAICENFPRCVSAASDTYLEEILDM